MQYLVPEYVYTPEGLQPDRTIAIGDDGRIAALLSSEEMEKMRVEQADVLMLPGVALLPGFVNVHSHVFQRALRGHTHRPISGHDTFWTWRRAMYAEAQQLNPDWLYKIALSTYGEMLAVGYTSVGEFHYVHHQPGGQPYADPNAMSQAILSAGRDAGMRVVLLIAAYAQSGFNTPLEPEQLRFVDASVEAYLERVELLRASGVPVGVAPHSVRAVPEGWFRAIASYSQEYSIPLHVHAAEQSAEVEQSQAVYGCGPIELLERFGALGKLTTIIHATHANAREIDLLAGHGCIVCVCPTTEGDLGDGIAPYIGLLGDGIPLSIGSDSNTRLDPMEELRWAEYTARMRYQRRRVLVDDERNSPGPFLLAMGTRQGAAALGIEAGSIAPGKLADLVAIDLHHPSLDGWTLEDFLDVLFFGASSDVIAGTWVNGRRIAN